MYTTLKKPLKIGLMPLAIFLLLVINSCAIMKAPDREYYQNISKIKVDYPTTDLWIDNPKQVSAIVDEINSLSKGGWIKPFGKHPYPETHLYLYSLENKLDSNVQLDDSLDNDENLVMTFGFSANYIIEQGKGYRPIGPINSVSKSINIQKLPMLKSIWCKNELSEFYSYYKELYEDICSPSTKY